MSKTVPFERKLANGLRFLGTPSGISLSETMLKSVLQLVTYYVLVRATDMETIGLWVLVNSLLAFSNSADFWSKGLSSFVAEARADGNDARAAGFVSTAVLTGAIGYLVIVAVAAPLIYLFAGSLAGSHGAATIRHILPLMAANFWAITLAGVYQLGLLGFGKPLIKAIQNVGGAVLFLVLVMLLAPRFGIFGLLWAQLGQALAMLVFAVLAFHVFTAPRASGRPWKRDRFVSLIRFGSKALVVGSAQMAIQPIIRLMVNEFGGLASVAAVELAARFIAVVHNLILSPGQILVPAFAQAGARGAQEVERLYLDTTRFFVLLALALFSLLIAAAPIIQSVFLKQSTVEFLPYLWSLSLAWIANIFTASTFFLLMGQRQLRSIFWGTSVRAAGAILFGAIGGELAGTNGALMGIALAFVVSAFFLLWAARHDLAVRPGLWSCIRTTPYVLLPIVTAALGAVLLASREPGLELKHVGLAADAAAFAVTLIACLVFGRIGDILRLAQKVRL